MELLRVSRWESSRRSLIDDSGILPFVFRSSLWQTRGDSDLVPWTSMAEVCLPHGRRQKRCHVHPRVWASGRLAPLPLASLISLPKTSRKVHGSILVAELCSNQGHWRICVCVCLCRVRVLLAQWSPTLCDPTLYPAQAPLSMGILQARILEWIAIPFSGGSSWPRDRTRISCITHRFFTIWATKLNLFLKLL